MKLSIDHVPSEYAFVNGEEPLAPPFLVVRDDRRSIMGRDIDDNLVVISSNGSLPELFKERDSQIELNRLKDLKTNVVDNILSVNSTKPLSVFPVNVDGLDCAFIFAEEDISGAHSFRAFTSIDVGLNEAKSAVDSFNRINFSTVSDNELDSQHGPLDDHYRAPER